jgi:hypothetical protein
MAMKARISFDLDLPMMNGVDGEGIKALVVERLLVPARDAHKDALHTVRKDDTLSSEDKVPSMGRAIASMQMALMAEATLTVEVTETA